MVRLIDANANRAGEAARTLEDLARFALDRADLSAQAKAIRHGVRGALEAAGLDSARLLACRDTPGDVGTTIKTDAEATRASPASVADAAAGRLAEALRVLGEGLKVLGRGEAAATMETLRYASYDLHKRLGLALGSGGVAAGGGGAEGDRAGGVGDRAGGGSAGPWPRWRVCVIITAALCRDPSRWEDVAASAAAGGADMLQLREKGLTERELLARARRLVDIARSAHAGARDGPAGRALAPEAARPTVIINDRVDIALLSGADGVHLGQDDLPVAAARALAGRRLLVGVSTHDLCEARAAAAAGADYVGVGAMFPTATKPRAVSGIAYLRAYLAEPALARVPHLAIGGVRVENAGALAGAGCVGVAVSAAVCGSDDPGGVCAALRGALESGGALRGGPGGREGVTIADGH